MLTSAPTLKGRVALNGGVELATGWQPLGEREDEPRLPLPNHHLEYEAVVRLEVGDKSGAVVVDQPGEGQASPTCAVPV